MDAPVNIVVESPDGKAAELVGRAIGQALKDTYGFNNVTVANIQADTPGFRAWTSTQGIDEQPDTLLDAMRDANPQLFDAPVTVVSRENANVAEINTDGMGFLSEPRPLSLGAIGQEGITAEEALVLDGCIVEPARAL
jgi:hypothetical protein